MTNKNKNKKSNANQKARPTGPGKKKKTRKLSPYTNMLLNPCSADLLPGIHGTSDGFVGKFKLNLNNNSSGKAGYILWIPQLSNAGEADGTAREQFNVYAFSGTNGTQSPENTTGNPLGTDGSWAVNGSGFSLIDPSSSFLQGNLAQCERLISACIRVSFIGAMSDSSGQIGYIKDFDPRSLIAGGGVGDSPPSVDQVFNLCAKTVRIGTDTHENIYSSQTPNDGVWSTVLSSGWDSGVAASVVGGSLTTVGGQAGRFRYPAFGFCWRGLTTTTANMVFELTKNIEWRPEPVSGLVQPRPHHHGPSLVQSIMAQLDNNAPGWSERLVNVAATGASRVAQAAFTGVLHGRHRNHLLEY